MTLPAAFLTAPLAHRGLHGADAPENSPESFRRAVAHGYGIELDLQPSADGVAMVFHDATLDRMTAETGPVRDRTAAELGRIALNGTDETIPTLAEVLAIAADRSALLIELKDQSGGKGGTDGVLEAATIQALDGYHGPAAVMSFNPAMVAILAELAPDLPRGLTTSGFHGDYWSYLPAATADHLRAIPDFDAVGACFVSHDKSDLAMPRVAELKARGVPILTWTIRSPAQEAIARQVAANVTFEGYMAAIPGR